MCKTVINAGISIDVYYIIIIIIIIIGDCLAVGTSSLQDAQEYARWVRFKR
jgi:uncharacterized Tic20 family protein